ncbi:MAG: alpha-glucan phosphorylase, partial [Clostridia bacterium]|nr:alpha-glucan phosphorylase [Clostridia bacterium]
MAYTTSELKKSILDKLSLTLGTAPDMATEAEMMKACALVLRDIMALRGLQSEVSLRRGKKRKVHYLSLEFLMGRSLMKNACNLGVLENMSEALEELGFHAGDVFEAEPDAGLGNGGLG